MDIHAAARVIRDGLYNFVSAFGDLAVWVETSTYGGLKLHDSQFHPDFMVVTDKELRRYVIQVQVTPISDKQYERLHRMEVQHEKGVISAEERTAEIEATLKSKPSEIPNGIPQWGISAVENWQKLLGLKDGDVSKERLFSLIQESRTRNPDMQERFIRNELGLPAPEGEG